MQHLRSLAQLLTFFLLAAAATADDFIAGPEDYRQFLPHLKAGDRLLLRPGDYLRGLPLHDISGEAARPIVVEGHPGTRLLARHGANTVSLVNVRHLVLRNLELDGHNLPVDAVKAEGHSRHAHYITLENLYIHDHAAHQQNVGISSKCPAFGWVVRGNRIERVGTGMYFGDSDGSDPFVAGVIEDNLVRDTLGYNLQIKHQKSRPAGMPEPEKAHVTVIRRNVFAKETALPGPQSRPNVLVGHSVLTGPGEADRVLVYGNLFWQNPSEALFQGEGHLALYNNVFVNHSGHALHIQPHNDLPREVDIFSNTVVALGNGIRLIAQRPAGQEGDATPLPPPRWVQRIGRNLVFAARPIEGGEGAGNLIGAYADAAVWLRRVGEERHELDATPARPLPTQTGATPRFPESRLDIDGRARQRPTPGACLPVSTTPCPSLAHVD